MKTIIYLSVTFIFLLTSAGADAQPQLEKDYSYVMEIPSVMAMESSPAHLYVLSNTEGMVVFRSRTDTLQWLYSSTGMEQRGNTMTADIRFAYLFGYNRRLTVLEPTSVLGVYSSTLLPAKPLDARRIDQSLYVALGDKGLGRLSLRTPASVDSTIDIIESNRLKNQDVIDLEASEGQLFALTSQKKLFIFDQDKQSVSIAKELSLLRELQHIFLINQRLLGSDHDGNIYEIDRSGNLSKIGSINEGVKKIIAWNDFLIIKGTSNRLWTSYLNRAPVLWKDDAKAGNYITVSKGQFWLSEYNQISKVVSAKQSAATVSSSGPVSDTPLKLKPIKDQIIPYPNPLLLPLELQEDWPAGQVQFSYQSDIETAKIKGEGFYWQPKADDIGQHRFSIIATSSGGKSDSTSFKVEVRSFNAPPRFTPLRSISIPVGEPFNLPIKAIDRDGMDPNLVRYLGVDLPQGATINEQTGAFNWTPTARQTGENKFRIIATDQFGAATSVDVSIKVLNITRDDESGN